MMFTNPLSESWILSEGSCNLIFSVKVSPGSPVKSEKRMTILMNIIFICNLLLLSRLNKLQCIRMSVFSRISV